VSIAPILCLVGTAVWLRFAELRAAGKQAEPFDRTKFKDAAPEIRDWVPEPITPALMTRMKDLLASTGVVFVIVREFEGSRASGATSSSSWPRPGLRAVIRIGVAKVHRSS
jgi:hypothetical protein